MPKKKEELLDPTLPFTEIEIGGKTYKMCFDHGALCEAEAKLIRDYPEVNLLHVLPDLTGNNTRIVFALSLRKFQPDMAYEDALKLVDRKTFLSIGAAVINAWRESMPEATKEEFADPQ